MKRSPIISQEIIKQKVMIAKILELHQSSAKML